MNHPPDPDRPDLDRAFIDQCQACGAPLEGATQVCNVCGVRQRVRPTDVRHRPSSTQGRPWWVPAGIAAGGVAAILGGGLIGILLLGDPEPDLAGASATPTPSSDASEQPTPGASASPNASASPDQTATPSGDPTPSPVVAAIIPNKAIVEVTTDELNLRAAAFRTSDILAVLKQGQRLFVIGDPVQVDDLRWYRVAMVNDPVQCAETCGLIGFVATPLSEDDRWVAERETHCPDSPMTAEALARLQPLEALSCYGRDELAITGTMEHPLHGSIAPYEYVPAWMRPTYTAHMRHAWWLSFAAPPDSGLEMPEHGTIVRATGHFEHPSAVDCRASVMPEFFGGEVPDDFPVVERARVVLDCRATFVWTGYEVLGTEVVPMPSAGPVPDNDAPSGAIPIDDRLNYMADTTGTASEPEHACLDAEGSAYQIGKTTWWSFVGNGSTMTVDSNGSNFDTILGAYRDDGDGRLTPIGCVDDVAQSLHARIAVDTEEGVRYLIQAGGYNGLSGDLVIIIDE